jgi:Domain of unknown function (DUF6894)
MTHYHFHCFKDGVEMEEVDHKELPSVEAALDHAKVVAGAHRTLMANHHHLNVAVTDANGDFVELVACDFSLERTF